ncbi:MAG: peroxiredoxin [Cyanobacteria bacterium J06592_8]
MARLTDLPNNIPIPEDDGACDHLQGKRLPSVVLFSTQGRSVDLSSLRELVVIYCYPMTGKPDLPLPDGWDQIPGARGCTPQSCAFRDHSQELNDLGARVFGLSTQNTEDQLEAAQRLHLPFELLSDCHFQFTEALKLPTFEVERMRLLKRMTLIVKAGEIIKVFYPVFPPDQNAEQVIEWLRNQ